jgi:hypothetical protein
VVFNKALLGKWLWRYGIEREAWWRIAVDSKFGSLWGGWCSLEPTGTFGVGLWKNIRKGWKNFVGFSRFEVGGGARTKFWHDLWCGNSTLKEAFPVLFGIARAKDASVADNVELVGGFNQWSVRFFREAHDWEVDTFAAFFQVLHSVSFNRGSEDKLWWIPSKKGLFKVGSFFSSLACDVRSHFPWKSAWRTQAPPRAAFFGWSAALGKILTGDNLRKRHVIVVDRCCMCKRSGESVDHLLLHCDVAYAMWSAIFSRFGLSWVMPLRVLDLFACWWTAGRPRSAVIWKMVPTCILWCVWKERNYRCFEDLERSSEEILASFFHTLYLWTVAFVSPLSFTFDEFLVRFSLSS